MEIEFLEDHLFIKKGTVHHLDNFSVLTGANGSGKTSFLRGVALGKVKIDGVAVKGLDIHLDVRFYDYDSFQGQTQREEFNVSLHGDSVVNQFWLSYQAYRKKGHRLDRDFDDMTSFFKKNIDDLSAEDFKNFPLSRKNERLELFDLNFFNDTAIYLGHQYKNAFNAFSNKTYEEENLVFDEPEFIKKYRRPPWEVINEIFQETGINYEFDISYRVNRNDRIQSQLIDKVNGEKVEVKNMSNGERTILSIISLIYNLSIIEDLPDVFLFDEPDALLHPEFSKKLISILYDYLVVKLGKKVIITTHSPSTVAIVPPGSIFLCEKQSYTLERITTDKALKKLTQNINSLSILYENRRQVFVESSNDVIYYDKFYEKLSQYLIPEISLCFISSGESRTNKNGGRVSNCGQVINITETLRKAGNNFVFGIIDRDISNESSEGVKVLGDGNRYSIENYIFDPLFVAALLLRERKIAKDKLGLDRSENQTDFKSFDKERLQYIADFILTQLATVVNPTETKKVKCKLINGIEIELPIWFLDHPGHLLEERVLKTFPGLHEVKRDREGVLKIEMIDKVIDDIVDLLSIDVLEVLSDIQGA